jgi:hypothetical protein
VRRSPPSAGRALLPALVILLLAVAFYGELAFTDRYTWFNQYDMCALEIPRLTFEAREIHGGRFPLWDPHIWAGQPFIGQTQPGPFYPLNLLFVVLPLRDGQLRNEFLNWYYILIHFQAVLFMYLLCRDAGRTSVASLFAGCVFAFAGFLGAVPWLDLMNGAVWAPLVFLFLFRILRSQKPTTSAAWCGVFLGVAWLSGHHEIPLLLSALVAGFLAAGVIRTRSWKLARLACASLLIAVLVGGAQLVPTYEFGHASRRWVEAEEPVRWNDVVPYTVHTKYSLSPQGLLGFVLPDQDPNAGSTMLVGVTVCVLAVIGFLSCWRKRRVRWMAIIGLLGLLYALGSWLFFHGLIYALIPMLAKARTPVRATYFCTLALPFLAAYGFDRVVSGHKRFRPAMICGLFLLTGLEISRVSGGRITSRAEGSLVQSLQNTRDLAGYLLAQPGPVRVAVNGEDVIPNFGDLYGVDVLQGFVAGASENVLRHELHTKRTQQLFAVTHYMAKSPQRPDQVEVFKGSSGIKLFRNPDAMPRVWAVHEVVRASDESQLRVLVQSAAFDFHRSAISLGEMPGLEICGANDVVSLTGKTTDSAMISARMGCRGMVVLADANFVGWEAWVDGRRVPLLEPYGVFKGVLVDGGTHTVEMRYRPGSVYLGLGFTVVGMMLAGLMLTGLLVSRDRKGV